MQEINALGLATAAITAVVLVSGAGIFQVVRLAYFVPEPEPVIPEAASLALNASFYDEITQREASAVAGSQTNSANSTPELTEVSGGSTNYTELFQAESQLSIGASPDQVQAVLIAFVDAYRGEIVPPMEPVVPIEPGEITEQDYLTAMRLASSSQLATLYSTTGGLALERLLALDDPQLLEVVGTLEKYVITLRQAPVPAELVDLHQRRLSAYHVVLSNLQYLRDASSSDVVGGLMALENLEAVRSDFDAAETELSARAGQFGVS